MIFTIDRFVRYKESIGNAVTHRYANIVRVRDVNDTSKPQLHEIPYYSNSALINYINTHINTYIYIYMNTIQMYPSRSNIYIYI